MKLKISDDELDTIVRQYLSNQGVYVVEGSSMVPEIKSGDLYSFSYEITNFKPTSQSF